MIRRTEHEFTRETAGHIICGPIPIPSEVNVLFGGSFHKQLPGLGSGDTWAVRMKDIAEAMILQGWVWAGSGSPNRSIQSIEVPGWKYIIQPALAVLQLSRAGQEQEVRTHLQALRRLGIEAQHEHSGILEAVCS